MREFNETKEYYVTMCYALKTYDRQSYKEQLDKIYNNIIDLKKKCEPRKKFKFSRRAEDFGVKADIIDEEHIVKEPQYTNIPGV